MSSEMPPSTLDPALAGDAELGERQVQPVSPGDEAVSQGGQPPLPRSATARGAAGGIVASALGVFRAATQDGGALGGSEASDSIQFDAEELMEGKKRKVSKMARVAEWRAQQDTAFTRHFLLAASIGFWVMIFSAPAFIVPLHNAVFGQRGSVVVEQLTMLNSTIGLQVSRPKNVTARMEQLRLSCSLNDFGRKRNVAEPDEAPFLADWDSSMSKWDGVNNADDVWCGLAPSTYSDTWPNIAQFIVFTVWTSRGATINNAFTGTIGTLVAVANIQFLEFLYPRGGRGHPCTASDASSYGDFNDYIVISRTETKGWSIRSTNSRVEAARWYKMADRGASLGRAIFHQDGTVDSQYVWFAVGWADKFRAKFESLREETCKPGSTVYDDPNFAKHGEFVCLLDALLVLLLFLLGNCSRNALLWGMSWHVYFVMNFMNPAKGIVPQPTATWALTEHAAVVFTTLVGALFSVVATILPFARLSNLTYLFDDAMLLTRSITNIWKESVTYLSGRSRSAARFQIETMVDALDKLGGQVNENIGGAWWESIFWRNAARRRALLGFYDTNVLDIKEMVYIVKTCVLSETFEGEHNRYWKDTRGPVKAIVEQTSDLMWLCLKAAKDGYMNPFAAEVIRAQVIKVKEVQAELYTAFLQASPGVTQELSEENTFAFALSYWSRKTTDFATHMVEASEDGSLIPRCSFFRVVVAGIISTWSPRVIFRADHLKYCFKNWVSLVVCFLLGLYGNAGFFKPYDATMSMTLCFVFVGKGSRHAYEKGMHRLLGVALGKSVPIIITSFASLLLCGSWERNLYQGVAIWLYVFLGCFLAYDSIMWSYVGCLVAGFGVYGLVGPCAGAATDAVYAYRYREIGGVIVAIAIQVLVYATLTRHSARSLTIKKMRQLSNAVREGIEAVAEKDVVKLKSSVKQSTKFLRKAKALAPNCDPKLLLYQGKAAPFKVDLCSSLLSSFEFLVSELRILEVATVDWQGVSLVEDLQFYDDTDMDMVDTGGSGIFGLLHSIPAMQSISQQLTESMALLSDVGPDMLADTAAEVCHTKLGRTEPSAKLQAATKLYEGLARSARTSRSGNTGNAEGQTPHLTDGAAVRSTVVVRALEHIAYHLSKMEERCIKEATQMTQSSGRSW